MLTCVLSWVVNMVFKVCYLYLHGQQCVQMMQGVSIRQPAESCWRPSGVGHVTCSTKVTFQQSKRRQAQTISGPAAVELLRLQLQYLIFLKQSDTISSLNQKPKTYLKL